MKVTDSQKRRTEEIRLRIIELHVQQKGHHPSWDKAKADLKSLTTKVK